MKNEKLRNPLIILAILILLLVVGGGAFYGGMKYQQSKLPFRADFQNRIGSRQGLDGGQRQPGAEAVRGEIISRDESSITVKLPDESSKIIFLSENTAINIANQATVDDLNVGDQVMVFGQTNSDGSVSATNIQVGFVQGGRGNPTP